MKNIIFVLAAVISLGLTGCKQDPLDGYSDAVKNAQPPGEKPGNRTSSESLIFDINDFYDVKETESLDLKITGRVIVPNLSYQITIENASDFPGMSFNAKGDFKWSPKPGFVKSGDDIRLPLKLLMVTSGKEVLIRRKEVTIRVLRQMVGPEVVSTNGLQEMIEGDIDTFTVTVKSPAEKTVPSIAAVLNRSGTEDGAVFIDLDRSVGTNPVRSTVDPTLWTFYMSIDLGDAEITDSNAELFFGLQAFSSYGLSSTVKSFSFKVKSNYVAPRTSWMAETTMKAGVETNFQFMVYDLKDEGRVTASISNCGDMLGAVCSCVPMARSQVQCSIRWTPPTSAIGTSTRVLVDSQNASPIPNDPRVQIKSFNGYVKVVAP